jgi:hypothetical protein
MAIMGHELYHCLLSDHKDITVAKEKEEETDETAASGKEPSQQKILQDIEDLYAEDRRLELEWLKEEYEEMGIVIDK